MTLQRSDLLALLEERPCTVLELAEWLSTTPRLVKFELKGLHRDGQVKRICPRWTPGAPGPRRWALASYTPGKGGTPVRVDHQARREQLLQQLEAGPATVTVLSQALQLSRFAIREALRELLTRGFVQQTRSGNSSIWALPTAAAPFPIPKARRNNPSTPWRDNQEAPKTATPASMSRTRVVPPPPKVSQDGGSSWWMSCDPNGFTAAAREHSLRMRNSKEHFQVKVRLLQ